MKINTPRKKEKRMEKDQEALDLSSQDLKKKLMFYYYPFSGKTLYGLKAYETNLFL